MKERPILFSGPMVRAIIDGSKTQTRRVVKDTGLYAIDAAIHGQEAAARELKALATRCHYGKPGDRLWVREAWAHDGQWCSRYGAELDDGDARFWSGGNRVAYLADAKVLPSETSGNVWRKRPSIHMPRWASRILLEIVSVRVERLGDISESDCFAEGIDDEGADYAAGEHLAIAGSPCSAALWAYARLWESINGPGSWDENPWVWVIEFRRIEA